MNQAIPIEHLWVGLNILPSLLKLNLVSRCFFLSPTPSVLLETPSRIPHGTDALIGFCPQPKPKPDHHGREYLPPVLFSGLLFFQETHFKEQSLFRITGLCRLFVLLALAVVQVNQMNRDSECQRSPRRSFGRFLSFT